MTNKIIKNIADDFNYWQEIKKRTKQIHQQALKNEDHLIFQNIYISEWKHNALLSSKHIWN